MNRTILFCCLVAMVSCVSKNAEHNTSLPNSSGVDSSKVKIFQRPYGDGDVVTKGMTDSSGRLWFCTSMEGVLCWENDQFTRFTEEDGLCGQEVWDLVEDEEGRIWFGTAKGLCVFDGNSFNNIPLPEPDTLTQWLKDCYPTVNPEGVASLLFDSQGELWIGSNGAGLYQFKNGEFIPHLQNAGSLMPDSLHHNFISDIIEDQEGNLWISSFSHGGVVKYNGSEFIHYTPESGLGDDMIASSLVTSDGEIWFGTRSGGMSKWKGEGFSTLHYMEGACQNHMATMFEDSKGRFWMASYARSGICLLDGMDLIPFSIENSERLIDVKCITEDAQGNIWFGGRKGLLWRFNGSELHDFTELKRNS